MAVTFFFPSRWRASSKPVLAAMAELRRVITRRETAKSGDGIQSLVPRDLLRSGWKPSLFSRIITRSVWLLRQFTLSRALAGRILLTRSNWRWRMGWGLMQLGSLG